MTLVVQFLIGLLFGSGLVIAGMANPQKVLNFLDVASISTGGWDPSLIFVMGGGVLVTYLGYSLVFKRPRPMFDNQFHLPTAKHIDSAIIVGPAIFGVGWGLAGFCPGPSLTAVGTGYVQAIIFVAAMLVGMVCARLVALKYLGPSAPAAKA